jgi:hypothetical protein
MKNDVRSIFGEGITASIEGVVAIFEKSGMTSEEIANHIEGMHETVRAGMHITAIANGNKELADRIAGANNIITQSRINEFKKSVAEGTHEQFLSQMPWTDKCSLSVDMRLVRIMGFDSETPLTPEEQNYNDIIQVSIDKDIEKEALSQGFQSVDAWREHNSKMSMQSNISSRFGGIREV